jgi:hypothetical protein
MSFKLVGVTSLSWFLLGSIYVLVQEARQLQNVNEKRTIIRVNPNRTRTKSEIWLEKFPFMPTDVPEQDRICFVHVGKTAGSTLACLLGFNYGCGNRIKILNGNLPTRTTNLIHTEHNDCKRGDYRFYLFVVREPLARIKSWFTYERPVTGESSRYDRRKPLFVDCNFTTLDELGGRTGLGSQYRTLCSRRAWKAVTGQVGYSVHNKYNYGYYRGQVPDDARIAVIRTEHLEQDWVAVEQRLLEGPAHATVDFPHRNRSEKKREDLALSVQSQRNICYALCEEIQIYKRILLSAANLDAADVETSMAELRESCPIEADLESCDEA